MEVKIEAKVERYEIFIINYYWKVLAAVFLLKTCWDIYVSTDPNNKILIKYEHL